MAIVSSFGEEVGRYSTRTTFDWANFFTALITYVIYGGLTWSVSLVLDDVRGIYNLLSTLQLIRAEKNAKNISTTKASYGQPRVASQMNKWKCKHCGTFNSEGKIFCSDCGKSKA